MSRGLEGERVESRATVLEPSADQLRGALHEWFGFADFLTGQGEVIADVLRGRDLLVVRPTGSGKSLCYQLPAVLLPPLTVVVSPLISLMKDQVDALESRHPGSATFINSAVDIDEQRRRLQRAVAGQVRLLFVAPERFRFAGFLKRLAETRIQRFVVDEAHCVSEWGHDFRPDYLHLDQVLGRLGDPPLLALTATATIEVQQDIVKQLGRPTAQVVVSGFNRPNLSFEVRYACGEDMKWRQLERLIAEIPGSGIVYAGTRRQTEEVAEFIRRRTERPVIAYHAGMEGTDRTQTQDAFMATSDGIAVATSAFGMGIDKPDVRFVIHYSLPGTVEAYYQQAGRAGRDGAPARCVLIYEPSDRGLQEWFIDQEVTGAELLNQVLAAVDGGVSDPMAVAARLGCTDIQARVALSRLHRIEYLRDTDQAGWGPVYQAVRPALTAADAQQQEEWSRARRAMRQSQLAAMVRYAEGSSPRRIFLLGYFGERVQPSEEELARDDPPPPAPDAGVITPEETELGRLLLETARAIRGGVGRHKLVQVLKGSQAATVGERLRRLPHFGALKRWRTEQLLAAVDHLVLTGLLKPVGGELPVMAVTPAGEAVLADERRLIDLEPLRLMAPVTAAARPGKDPALRALATHPLSPAEEELLARLRRWRTEQARQSGIAPYLVLGNNALEAVCRARPAEAVELLRVPGLGPVKVERYGGDLIALIRAWEEATGGEERPVAAPAPEVAPAPPPVPQRQGPVRVDGPALDLLPHLRQHGDLATAARAVGLAPADAANAVTTLVAAGMIAPAELIGADQAERIAAVLRQRPNLSLAEARRDFGPAVQFHHIRWVREALGKEGKEGRHPISQGKEGRHPISQDAEKTGGVPNFGPAWAGAWLVDGAAPDVGALADPLAEVLGGRRLELIAVVGREPELAELAARLSRASGAPVSFGMIDEAGTVLLPDRLASPLLLVGRPGRLRRLGERGLPGVELLLAVALDR